MQKGIIFDIQKSALHDGPGIRTVVFLKGCPLCCRWCCNPESLSIKPEIGYDSQKCQQCHACVMRCDYDALSVNNGKLIVNYEKCTVCGKCIPQCPTDALKIFGYETDVNSIMTEVLKDRKYYENSGGGLTLSGGDPLFQFDFALAILQQAKAEGLNTCLETEGFGARDKFEQLLPVVDHFLFDYKITNDELHRYFTGVSNDSILANLGFLAENSVDIVLRCIIVPGINDNEDHFRAITELSRKYDAIRQIEIMAYHDYGRNKYKMLGRQYPLDIDSVSKETATRWLTKLQKMGCRNVRIG